MIPRPRLDEGSLPERLLAVAHEPVEQDETVLAGEWKSSQRAPSECDCQRRADPRAVRHAGGGIEQEAEVGCAPGLADQHHGHDEEGGRDHRGGHTARRPDPVPGDGRAPHPAPPGFRRDIRNLPVACSPQVTANRTALTAKKAPY